VTVGDKGILVHTNKDLWLKTVKYVHTNPDQLVTIWQTNPWACCHNPERRGSLGKSSNELTRLVVSEKDG